MFSINVRSNLSLYEQIQKQIIEYIAMGLLKPQEQLPAVRTLAKELGINPNTVQKAYQECERDGFIYSIQGKGSFVCDIKESLTLIKQKVFTEITALFSDSQNLGLSKKDLESLMKSALEEVYHD